ncbi:M15 family metallopeptidase [Ornithinimicrobium flavum]|uniref:M15 family metallopeptidase n=1 Tax=Ornithinimicrobium flavum TaxID=1288636 RepID=UPI00106F3BF9|nr:M15 family metallopeptidase [Ornithinimicrobium flavum]
MRHRRARPTASRYAAHGTLLAVVGLGAVLAVAPLLAGPDPEAAAVAVPPPEAPGAPGATGAPEGTVDPDQEVADPGGAVDRLFSFAADPLLGLTALPPTGLEEREPERLYALVTRDRPVEPVRYAPEDLADLPGGFYQARSEVVAQTEALLAAALEEGHLLVVTSGFRDHDTQAGTYEDWVRQVGAARADQLSARPGHSEHQLGLAIDVAGSCSYQCFGQTEEGRWVAEHAHRWGFLVRYPKGGQEVTGYAPEPWHLRYVGPRAAWAMHLRGEPYWEHFAPLVLPD